MASAAVTIASQTDILNATFTGLKSENHEVRVEAAIKLQEYVRTMCSHLVLRLRNTRRLRLSGFECNPRYVYRRRRKTSGGHRQ